MTFEHFAEIILEELRCILPPEETVQLHPVLKSNDTKHTSIIISTPSSHIQPAIYLDEYYQTYHSFIENDTLTSQHIQQIISSILQSAQCNNPFPSISPSQFHDFNCVKDHICMKLLHQTMNQELLEITPYIPFLDLAIVFYIQLETAENICGSVLIQQQHLSFWNISKETLYTLAQVNTPRIHPPEAALIQEIISPSLPFEENSSFSELLSHLFQIPETELPSLPIAFETSDSFIVLSNPKKYYGAACILYSGILERFLKVFQCSFFLIPSSVHEILFLPDKHQITQTELNQMIREINLTEISPEERLSNHCYYLEYPSGNLK